MGVRMACVSGTTFIPVVDTLLDQHSVSIAPVWVDSSRTLDVRNKSSYVCLLQPGVNIDILGFITVLDKVNGVEYDRRNQRTAMLKGDGLNIRLAGNLSKALVKVLDEYPGADYYVVTSAKVETNQMFLGKEQTKSMTIKAYRYVHR